MSHFKNLLKLFFIGKSLDPFKPGLFKHVALISIFAWVGLGADGLSSSCYGPEQAYLALGTHTSLSVYIALGIIVAIFIIALGYNQVLELFPTGGGGYKVASQLLGPQFGVVSGAALIVDYVLTIAISIASGADAIYSFLPFSLQSSKLPIEICMTLLLILLNLRGMKESIKVLFPIFMGFVITHFILISYGIGIHADNLSFVLHQTTQDSMALSSNMGFLFLLAFVLHAYSLGSGTYTGLEAVSNNINKLAEPKVKTGKFTMFYIALSLSIVAAGITLLYLLWNATPTPGQTLNAVVFSHILGASPWGHAGLVLTLLFEGGILLVAANTGFLAGPAVLANMAQDNWLPRKFRLLSSRLVTSNGILVFGVCAILVLLLSEGMVDWLVVLYSINVFITFTLTLLGLSIHWIRHRSGPHGSKNWPLRLFISLLGFILTGSILIITIQRKFTSGGWVSLVITLAVIISCYAVKRHYNRVNQVLTALQKELAPPLKNKNKNNFQADMPTPALDPLSPTAIVLLDFNKAVGMHTLFWIIRHFGKYFKNYIFISVGQIDIENFQGEQALKHMTEQVTEHLNYFVSYCHQHGMASKSYAAYGPDVMERLSELSIQARADFSNHIFFAGQISFENDTWFKRLLHNGMAYNFQRKLHSEGAQILLLPMRLKG